MNPPNQTSIPQVRVEAVSVPPAKWWGGYVVDGNQQERRLVVRWGRIFAVLISLGLTGYLALATALWGYYSLYRKIPGVSWIDVAVLPRFSRVQAAIGQNYYVEAKRLWEKQDYGQAIMTARAAVAKTPRNLEARLFLAQCWQQAVRSDEAIRILKEGLAYDAADLRLQKTLVDTCLYSGYFQDVLKLLREDFPARGVNLLDGKDRRYQLVEAQAVLEAIGPAEAEAIVARRAGLADEPSAAPLLAGIDWELNRKDAAFERLRVAREHTPSDTAVQEAFLDTALRLGKADEARLASEQFLRAFPNHASAQLKFLETHGSRKGTDERPWTIECMRFLVQYQHTPAALGQLASLAADQGWTDLAFLLYQNSLQENLNGFPFAVYYIGSLVKVGDFVGADAKWHELAIRNAPQLAAAPYLEAMVSWGSGHESEAMQIVARLRRETENNRSKRKSMERLFRTFGFAKIADDLVAVKTVSLPE
jgi:tetratricopeptide (TPR) repeat protein